MSLFRAEALRHRQGEWLGTLQLSRPLPLAWITAGVVACVLALGLFLSWGQASRRVQVSGTLIPAGGLVRIVPPQVARVQRLAVQEGQQVAAGQLLMTLAVGDPRLAGAPQGQLQQTFDARLQSLADTERQTRRVAEAEQQSLVQRIDALQRELQQLAHQIQFHQQRLALAEQAQARLESLAGQQFVSTAQVQAKQEEVMGLRADGAALLRQRASLARDLADLQAQARELPAQTAQQLQSLARQRDEIRETATRADPAAADRVLPVTAPMAGTVTAIYAGAGQAVSDEFAMASLWPAGAPLQAHLYAPSSALGFVRPGQPVRLRLQALSVPKVRLAGRHRQPGGAGAGPGHRTGDAAAGAVGRGLAAALPHRGHALGPGHARGRPGPAPAAGYAAGRRHPAGAPPSDRMGAGAPAGLAPALVRETA